MSSNQSFNVSAPPAQDILLFQTTRLFKSLFKSQLVVLEAIAEEHDIAMDKLIGALPEEYRNFVELADYLSDTKRQILRKQTLGQGNDILREFERLLENFTIEHKK